MIKCLVLFDGFDLAGKQDRMVLGNQTNLKPKPELLALVHSFSTSHVFVTMEVETRQELLNLRTMGAYDWWDTSERLKINQNPSQAWMIISTSDLYLSYLQHKVVLGTFATPGWDVIPSLMTPAPRIVMFLLSFEQVEKVRGSSIFHNNNTRQGKDLFIWAQWFKARLS